MQTAGAGCEAPVRISGGGKARAEKARVGAGTGVIGRVSEIVGDSGERGVAGEILRLEIRGRRVAGRIAGEGSGCVSDSRGGVAGGSGGFQVRAGKWDVG